MVFGLAYLVNTAVVSVRKIRKQEQFIMVSGDPDDRSCWALGGSSWVAHGYQALPGTDHPE